MPLSCASGSTSFVSMRRAMLGGEPASTRFSHSMIQFSGRVSDSGRPMSSPSWPLRAVNVKRNASVAGVVPGEPLVLKFRLKSYAARTMLCPKR